MRDQGRLSFFFAFRDCLLLAEAGLLLGLLPIMLVRGDDLDVLCAAKVADIGLFAGGARGGGGGGGGGAGAGGRSAVEVIGGRGGGGRGGARGGAVAGATTLALVVCSVARPCVLEAAPPFSAVVACFSFPVAMSAAPSPTSARDFANLESRATPLASLPTPVDARPNTVADSFCFLSRSIS